MQDRTCPRCNKTFQRPNHLRTHLARKTPCAPIPEREDLPEGVQGDPGLEKKKCRFCGRLFSSYTAMRRHVRQNCGIAPNAKNGDTGMEKLYEHTIRRQQAQIDQLTSLVERLSSQAVAPPANTLAGPTITTQGDGNRILQDNRTQIVVNVHGQEGISHLTEAKVRGLLDDAIRALELPQAASQAVLKAAMLVYSDPEHPENLTAYLPNKKLNDVLVLSERQENGWEVQPTSLVLPPMAQLQRSSVDALFTKQQLSQREVADDYAPLLRELAENEARYTAGSDLRPIVPTELQNKDLLQRVLGTLPAAA